MALSTRIVKFFNTFRKPQYVVTRPGDVVLVNGAAYRVEATKLYRLGIVDTFKSGNRISKEKRG